MNIVCASEDKTNTNMYATGRQRHNWCYVVVVVMLHVFIAVVCFHLFLQCLRSVNVCEWLRHSYVHLRVLFTHGTRKTRLQQFIVCPCHERVLHRLG